MVTLQLFPNLFGMLNDIKHRYYLAAVGLIMALPPAWPAPPDLRHQAEAALQDEHFELAEKYARAYLEENGHSATGIVLLARALYGQEQYDAVVKLLGGEAGDAGLIYWRAAAEFKRGNSAAALNWLEELARLFPASEYQAAAARLRAWALLKLGRTQEAMAAFEQSKESCRTLAMEEADRLAWGNAILSAGAADAAQVIFTELANATNTAVSQQARLALARMALDRRQTEQARQWLAPVTASSNIPAEMRVMSLLLLSEAAEQETNYVAALELAEKCAKITEDPALKNQASLRKGLILLRMGKADEGTALVRTFVAAAQTNAAATQLQLAQLLQQAGLPEKALAEYQNYIETFADTPGLIAAHAERGVILRRLNRPAEAAAAFLQAANLLNRAPDRAALLRQAGDALLAAGQFSQAQQAYQQIIALLPESEPAAEALLQSALCQQKQEDYAAAINTLWRVLDNGSSDLAEAQALLQMAEVFLRSGAPQAARKLYRHLLKHAPPTAQALALYQLGNMDYRVGNFAAALDNFTRAEETASGTPAAFEAAASAAYMQAWCRYMLHQEAQAAAAFQRFLEQYPAAPQAPDAMFWLAEQDFNRRNFYLAEERFLRLSRDYPAAALADDALFRAAHAAMAQQEFRRANEHLALLLQLYPETDKKALVRLYQGEALCELGDFADAILIFDEIIKLSPDTYAAEQAWFRKGDSLFTLGADDPRRYAEALSVYTAIASRPDVPTAAYLQAAYKIGRCLEKMGREQEAFEKYMDVVYAFFNHPEARAQSASCFTRAAFGAAGIKEREKAWRKAAAIYQRVVDAQVAASRDAAARLRKIRLENWMFFY